MSTGVDRRDGATLEGPDGVGAEAEAEAGAEAGAGAGDGVTDLFRFISTE